MTRQVKRRRQPNPSLHVELPSPSPPQPPNRRHRRLKRRRVHRHPIPHPPEIRQVERHRPHPRDRPGRILAAEDPDAGNGAGLPDEDGSKPDNPEDGEEGDRVGEDPMKEAAVVGEVEQSGSGGEDLDHGWGFGEGYYRDLGGI